MALEIKKISNANLYVGSANWAGRVSEIQLPELTDVMEEYSPLAMHGTLELSNGLEAMEATMTFMAPTPELIVLGADTITAQQLTVRGSLETFVGGGRAGEAPFKVFMVGTSKGFNLGTFTAKEGAKPEITFRISRLTVEIGGQLLMEIDVNANVRKVEGRDLLEQYLSLIHI